tara:strand:+ start:673 stop:1677 length:1005 start_codon:yes stop_codon:yes gene_type:complete
MLNEIKIPSFKNSEGSTQDIILTYQTFGKVIGSAPLVLVTHALTGNSTITGEYGWWKDLIGKDKLIDINLYTVLAFDMPGNGFSGDLTHLITNYKEFTLKDIAKLYSIAFKKLEITEIYAGIGGSIGGALLWEIATQNLLLFKHLIPIAADYKSTQWVKALCKVQDSILLNSKAPVEDARMHAMTFYRTPESLKEKFNDSKLGTNNVEDWLEFHGKKLEARFQLKAYKLMNHLLTTVDISDTSNDFIDVAAKIPGDIHIVTVNSDGLFLANENWETYVALSMLKSNVFISEIRSIHGHDAFLIEYEQLTQFLTPIFKLNKIQNEKDKYSALRSR